MFRVTQNRRNPFAETGAASSVLALKEDLGLDFVGSSQSDITPFQRQMFEAEKARQARAEQEKMEEARNPGGGGRQPNSMNSQSPPDSGISRSETIRYISDSKEDSNSETLSVID